MSATKITFSISICPTSMEVGSEGDTLDREAYLAAIKNLAKEKHPRCQIVFSTLQVGHRQGHAWLKSWKNGVRDDSLAMDVIESIDTSDESLYA